MLFERSMRASVVIILAAEPYATRCCARDIIGQPCRETLIALSEPATHANDISMFRGSPLLT